MKKLRLEWAVLFFSFLVSGCSVIQGMRDDIDEEQPRRKIVNEFDYKAPENRNLPPPPTTVSDDRVASIAGTPLDLSGARAKSGRVTKNDFLNEGVKNENSLWAEDGQHNYLFARNKLKSNGDLVTIHIEEQLRKDMIMEVKKLLPPEFRDRDIVVPGITKETPVDGALGRAPAGAAEGAGALAGATGVNVTDASADTMTAEVLERYPNGNVRIRGVKSIPFKKKVRNMDVVAIVKGTDIDENDQVHSSKFLEHKAELYK